MAVRAFIKKRHPATLVQFDPPLTNALDIVLIGVGVSTMDFLNRMAALYLSFLIKRAFNEWSHSKPFGAVRIGRVLFNLELHLFVVCFVFY